MILMNKLRVGVFMGGKSIEKEASFNSGRTVCDHLDTIRYDILPIFQRDNGNLYILPERFIHRGKIADFEHRLESEAQRISWDDLKKLIDFMYIAAHGRFAEDGTLQGFLEVLGIPYLGSKILASALCMDKIVQKNILQSAGIHVPPGITFTPDTIEQLNQQTLKEFLNAQSLQLPCIIKPHCEGSSLGISVAYTIEQALDGLSTASSIDPHKKQSVIIEEYIHGMEFTCIIITDYKTGQLVPLLPTEIVLEENTRFFDYQQKYMPGRATKFTPARCSQETLIAIQQTALKVMQLLGIENIARIDGFVLSDGTIAITDPNTLAGMAPSSFIFRQAAELNMSHTHFINHLIETELARYTMLKITEDNPIGNKTIFAQTKKRIAVLFGGRSHEREISLESGRNIIYKLSPEKYDALPLFVDDQLNLYQINQALLVRNSNKEIALGLTPEMHIPWSKLPTIADFVFLGLHGGEGENGAIQGTLEMLEMPYNGSGVLTSALCMDKFKTTAYLAHQGFAVPHNQLIDQKSWLINQKSIITQLEALSPYPLIVKPHDDGCSVMVQKVRTTIQLINAIDTLFANGKEYALIEECIVGMELTVGVIGNRQIQAFPPSRAVCTQDILSIEEKFLPGAGENQTPAPLPEATLVLVKKTMEDAYKALNCKGYARIDCFYQNASESPTGAERIVIIEVNTLPGMTPATCIFHQAAELGMKPMDFIDLIIQLGFEEHSTFIANRSEHTYKELS